MSERELRDELASIARAARKLVERQGPGAELMAQSAARGGGGRGAGAEGEPIVADATRGIDRARDVDAAREAEGPRPSSGPPPAPRSPYAHPPEVPPPVRSATSAPTTTRIGAFAGPRTGAPVISRAPAIPPARPAAPAPPRAPAPPTGAPKVNLFGEAEPEPVPVAPQLDDAFRPSVEPLYPADPAARAPILAASLPVLQEIASEVVVCTKCGLCETRTRAVPGVGSAESGILFVGEAPGAEEDRQGEPFVGRAGELLTKIIKAMDEAKLIPGVPLTRQTVYIANVLKCRPPENRNPLPHEIETCSPYLMRQLEALQPRVICCLGKFAAELLLGIKGTIAGMRGKVYRYKGSKLIVTYHPAACLRNPNLKRPVWEDMQLLAREYLAD